MKWTMAIVGFVAVTAAAPVFAQSNWTAEISGGAAAPVGDIGSRLNTGWDFDFSGGYQFTDWLSLLGDFGFAGFGVPANILQEFNAPVGHGRIVTLSLDPEVQFPVGHHLRGFVIGGAGWVHRAVELTAPSLQYVDIYDPVYGDLGPQPIASDQVLSSVTRDALGENIGGGVSFPLVSLGADLFAAVRYYRAPTSPSMTTMMPITFGIRWTGRNKP